ncbi:MAG TPA: alkaline phosphatase family protein [Alloacidobacterium sp.]|nr:alkaline phosphatase family protein [Alloacidobacterium sp.]
MSKFSWKRVAAAIFAATVAVGASHTAFADKDKHEDRVATAAAYVKHVFVIVLENKNYNDTFGTSTQDPYLQNTLVPMGGLLTQYYGTGHVSLDNYISMISGQAPTPDTDNDCLPGFTGTIGNYNNVKQTGVAPQGQVIATGGCIYAKNVPTLPKQLEAAGLSWRGYMGDMGNDPARESATCGHPAIGVGTDNTNSAEAPSAAVPLGDAYATRHDPFMYFHSIIDDQASCSKHVVNLNRLTADLKDERSTPNLVFITPNLCDDGHDGSGTGEPGTTCANGQPGGLASADAFLKTWVPKIMESPAYKKDGLLIITFDESSYTQSVSTSSTGQTTVDITFPGQTCCNQQPGPNLSGVRPGSFTLVSTPTLVENIVINGFGGDRIGALLLSPFVKPGSTSDTAYNHYSLLKSLEDIFHLDHIGYAADDRRTHYSVDTIGDDEDIFFPGPGRGHGHGHGHDFDYPSDPHFKHPWF